MEKLLLLGIRDPPDPLWSIARYGSRPTAIPDIRPDVLRGEGGFRGFLRVLINLSVDYRY